MAIGDTDDRGELVWEGNRERLHIRSRFTAESLLDKDLIVSTYTTDEVAVLPDAALVHIGGVSIMDQGVRALNQLVPEIVECRRRHRFVLSVGGGARERHAYAMGIDLGLPTGALADIAWMNCEQNAVMLFNLLARHKAIEVPLLHYEMLPVYLREGSIPIVMNMPKYFFWEHPPATGRIPPHRPDTGAFLMTEVWSMRDCIYLKDVDGLYTDNPKTGRNATFIPEIRVHELLGMKLPDLPIEREVLETLAVARNRTSIRIVNGLVPGNLTRALDGQPVGTLITQ
ncbi:MAG: uridine kinase [Candidatus Rokuibacteriota bacterium]